MKINNYPLIFKIKVVNYYYLYKPIIKNLLHVFGICKSTLYNWLKLYTENKLAEKQKYNKISKYTNSVKEYIIKYVCKKINFNCKKITMLVKTRFNINCSKSAIYSILKQNNITHKRIKIKTKFSNKSKTRKMINILKKNVNAIGKENIISIDESSFDTHINSHYGWSKKGSRINAIKRKQRIRYSVISAISMNKVINVTIIKGSVNSIVFIEFIKNVINKIQKNKVLFMDNARIHHSKLFTEYIKTIKNKVLYNVPYCSEYNPIEMVFSKVKSMVHKRTNNTELINLHKNIKYGFNKIIKSNLVGYYNKCLSF